MKKIAIVSALLLFLFVQACNKPKNEKKSNEKAHAEKQTAEKSESGIQETSPQASGKTMKARFKKYMFSDLGAIYVFVDESGKEWKLQEHGDTEGTGFAGKLKPKEIYSRFDSQWFEVTWGKRKLEFYDAGNDATTNDKKIPILISAKKMDPDEQETAEIPAITFKELQQAVFFGTEPFWTIKFKDSYMSYTGGIDAPEKRYNYIKNPGGNPVKAISENEVQIKVKTSTKETDQINWKVNIRKEPCSDGMSDNSYPYTIKIFKGDEENQEAVNQKGCGRIVYKTVSIQEIKQSKKIVDYPVSEFSYEPGDEFIIGLSHDFQLNGHFTINPMSGQLNFNVDKDQRPKINVKIEDFTRPLITFFRFQNEEDIKKALGNDKIEQIREGKKIDAEIAFNDYHIAAKLHGGGTAYAKFIRIIN